MQTSQITAAVSGAAFATSSNGVESRPIDALVKFIRSHRCFSHPVFKHWSTNAPAPETIGALFHQIRCFCDSTRPGRNLPAALQAIGGGGSRLLQEIVDSEEDHGPQLATMAGYIMNRAAGDTVCADLYNQAAVENTLRQCSDRIMGALPGYDPETGLMPQTRRARAVFERRERMEQEVVLQNLGTTIALEMISNRHLIPGEKQCLVDAGLYNAGMEEPEMHYLLEHYGETGAEAMHEQHAIDAVATLMTESNQHLFYSGASDFLDSLAELWDLLDSALLESGAPRAAARRMSAA